MWKLKLRKAGTPLRAVQKGQSRGEERFLDLGVGWGGVDRQPPAFRQGCSVPAAAFSPGAWCFLGVPQESSRRGTVELITKPHCCLAGSYVLTLFPLAQVFLLVLEEHIVIMLIMLAGQPEAEREGRPSP